MADPVDTVTLIQGDDPHREDLVELLTAWHAVYGSEQMTVKQVINDVVGGCFDDDKKHLKEVMLERFSSEHGKINARRVAGYIRQHQRRVESGMCFRGQRGHANLMYWQVVCREPDN
jgi:hypothetical protein